MKIVNCKINHLKNPLGYAMKTEGNPEGFPLFMWEPEDVPGNGPASVQLQVAVDSHFQKLIYDSGLLPDYKGCQMLVPFHPQAYTRYFWRVSLTLENGEGAVSNLQFFETAKEGDPWNAEWIGCPEEEVENPVFIKRISCADNMDARAYVCGLGMYEIYLNGEKCGDEFFAPGCTEYDRWIQYQTYELPLKKGDNEIRISLGNGWYKGRFGLLGGSENYGSRHALICEIRNFATGKILAKTDESWEVRKGRIIFNNLYDGEELGMYEEKLPKGSAEILPYMNTKATMLLTERYSVPVRVHEVLDPVEILLTPLGETVLDFGQNMAGFVRFETEEAYGTTIRLQYGEILQDGNFYRDNLRSAKAEFIYRGNEKREQVRAHFTYYGFRYVKVEGLTKEPSEYHFQACALYSDLEMTGVLETGSDKVNRLISNITWGLKSNYVDVPTDCPQRDERLGWTGDTQVFAGAASYLTDSYPFLKKFCKDLFETQKKAGCVTNTIPAFGDQDMTCAGWGDAAVIIPWTLYRFYGDRRILADQFDSMKAWADSIYEQDEANGWQRLWRAKGGFGDWLAKDHDDPDERMLGGTDLTYVSSAFYYYSTDLTAKAASIIGDKTAPVLKKRAEEIREAFLKEYFTPTGRLAVPTQTGYVLALYMKLFPEGKAERVAAELHQKLVDAGMRLKTGFIGTAYILKVLSEYGYHEDACRILLNEEQPGWLYAINLGATTLWERWDSLLPDGRVNGTDMNSFNHYASGAVAEWMYGYLAGIRQDVDGFRKAVIRPMPCRSLKKLRCCYRSASGTYEVKWDYLPDKKISVIVTIPYGAAAHLELPFGGGIYELGGGTYKYTYRREHDDADQINTFMPFSQLRKMKEVKPVLEKHFPGWAQIPESFAKESLREMAERPYFHIENEAMNAIDREIRELFERY